MKKQIIDQSDFMIALDRAADYLKLAVIFKDFEPRSYQYFWIKLQRWRHCQVSAALADSQANDRMKHRWERKAKAYQIPACYIEPIISKLRKAGITIGGTIPKKWDNSIYIPEENQ